MFEIILLIILVSIYNRMKKNGKLDEIRARIRETQSETFTPSETSMQMMTQAQAEMHERVMQKQKDGDRAAYTPSDPGVMMSREDMDKRKAEIRERLAQKQQAADPHYMPPKAAADSYHNEMDKCDTAGCYNGQPAPKKPDFNDPRYMPSAAKIPSAKDISRMQTTADDCDTPGCDVDKSVGNVPAAVPAANVPRYPLGYQLTLAEAILHRGGRRRRPRGGMDRMYG